MSSTTWLEDGLDGMVSPIKMTGQLLQFDLWSVWSPTPIRGDRQFRDDYHHEQNHDKRARADLDSTATVCKLGG